MSKKFTSFLVVLAALLLTVPTQAQFAKKAAKQTTVLKAGPLKVNDVQKVKAAKDRHSVDLSLFSRRRMSCPSMSQPVVCLNPVSASHSWKCRP